MALFKRKDKQSVLPEEVNEYYQSQRRERTGMAVAMGLLALVVTVLIGAALFFGGKYIYDKIVGDDDANSGVVETAGDNNGSTSIDGGTSPVTDSDNVKSDGNTDKNNTSDDSASNDTGDFGEVSLDGDDSQAATQPETGDEAAMPDTGDQQVLPATGDPGH